MATDIPLKFIKATQTPDTWEINAVYFILDGAFAEAYVTSEDGTPEEIGNTDMIQKITAPTFTDNYFNI